MVLDKILHNLYMVNDSFKGSFKIVEQTSDQINVYVISFDGVGGCTICCNNRESTFPKGFIVDGNIIQTNMLIVKTWIERYLEKNIKGTIIHFE